MDKWERELKRAKNLAKRASKPGEGVLTKSGRLQEQFLPAVYMDSSVLIDYWITEGMENWTEEDYEEWKRSESNTLSEALMVVREILKSDVRLNKVTEIRKKLIYG